MVKIKREPKASQNFRLGNMHTLNLKTDGSGFAGWLVKQKKVSGPVGAHQLIKSGGGGRGGETFRGGERQGCTIGKEKGSTWGGLDQQRKCYAVGVEIGNLNVTSRGPKGKTQRQ